MRTSWFALALAPVTTAATWTLKNSALSAELAYDGGRGVTLKSFISATGRQFTAPGSPARLFQIRVRHERQAQGPNGANVPPAYRVEEKKEYDRDGAGAWTLSNAAVDNQDGTTVTLRLQKTEPQLEIVLFEDTSETSQRRGSSLADEGLQVSLPARHTSALVYLSRK